MTLYLLGKSKFNSSEELVINDRPIYEEYERLSKILAKHCSFISLAEPAITTNKDSTDSFISWYADTKKEPVLPSNDQQSYIDQKIAEAISNLSQAYPEGSEERTLLNAALNINNKQDILIADDQIIFKEWGGNPAFHPVTSGTSLFPLADKDDVLPKMISVEQQSPQTENTQQSIPAASSTNNISSSPSGIPPLKTAALNKYTNRTLIYITRLLTAILFFIIGLLLGWRILYAERPTKIAKVPVIEAQDLVKKKPGIEKKNKSLEDEIKQLEEQLKKPPCDLNKNRASPELNKSLDNSSAPMNPAGKNFQGSLPELLEKSTVFILVKAKDENGSDVIESGSGFFITPDLIATNRHVVEDADGNIVLVTNKSLGQLKKAHIVSISDRSQDVNSFDLAVLKIEDAPPQQPLSFSLDAQPLQTVVAAGYPGIIIRQDGALKRLAQGDINAIPGVVLTKGEINAIQTNSKGEKIIPHSASVSPGNSGGALVDLCGRVVGINTFVTMDSETSSHSNYAQKSDSIVQALQGANIPVQVQSGACKDTITAGTTTPETTAPTPQGNDQKNSENTQPPKPVPTEPNQPSATQGEKQ